MLLFRSEEHAGAWSRARGTPAGAFLTLEQQWELARAWYSGRFSADWRRPTPAEAEAILAGIGLTGDFWRLR